MSGAEEAYKIKKTSGWQKVALKEKDPDKKKRDAESVVRHQRGDRDGHDH